MVTDAAAFTSGEAKTLAFTGLGREYFGIWVVNFTLSVLTLGIYSAWAKVRRLQYFYRHTRLAGATFDYHGEPLAILKGRVVALFLLALYTFAGYGGPLVAGAALAVVALVLPWLLARSLMFRLSTTSYRGLRFAFRGSTAQAYWVFLALPVLSVVTLFVMAPFCHHRIKRYQIAHAAWGSTPFYFGAPVGRFYRIYFGALGLLLALSIVAAIAMGVMALWFGAGSGNGPRPFGLLLAGLVVYGTLAVVMRAFLDARVRALVWGRTWVGDHRIVSG